MIAFMRHYIAVFLLVQPCPGNKQIYLLSYTAAVSGFIPFLPVSLFCGVVFTSSIRHGACGWPGVLVGTEMSKLCFCSIDALFPNETAERSRLSDLNNYQNDQRRYTVLATIVHFTTWVPRL